MKIFHHLFIALGSSQQYLVANILITITADMENADEREMLQQYFLRRKYKLVQEKMSQHWESSLLQ